MMRRDFDREPQGRREHWRVGVCLAVIAVLLYNPFFTILSSSHEISVRHALSYRATVASSELRRGTLEPAKPLLPELAASLFCAAIFLRTPDEGAMVRPRDAVAPALLPPCDNIWFRPPPSA